MKIRYVHIPKAGGTSILKTLRQANLVEEPEQVNLRMGNHQVYVENRPDIISMAVVRNPYDRAVSAFHYLKGGGSNNVDTLDGTRYCYQETFLEFCLDPNGLKKASRMQLHFVPQSYFMPDGVDIIIKLERINEYSDKIANLLHIDSFNIPHLNKSSRGHWKDYYIDETINIVKELYMDDFIKYGYSTHPDSYE